MPPVSSKTMQIKPPSFSRNSKTSHLFQALCLIVSAFPDKQNTWSFLLRQHMTRMRPRLLGIQLGWNPPYAQMGTPPSWKKRWEKKKISINRLQSGNLYCLESSTVCKISFEAGSTHLVLPRHCIIPGSFYSRKEGWWQSSLNSVSILCISHLTDMRIHRKER